MSIRRITVEFVGPDGTPRCTATGSVDRRIELIREARAELESFKILARREGDPMGDVDYRMSIVDAPAMAAWTPKR